MPKSHRTLVKSVRFAPEEWAEVEARAAEVSLSPGRYLREAALQRRLAGRVEKEAVRQLIRTGVNLNQVARTANALGRVELSRRLAEVLEVLEVQLRELVR